MNASPKQNFFNNKRLITAVVVGFLLVINGLQYYFSEKNEVQLQNQIDAQEIELRTTYIQLDSISKEIKDRIEQIQELGGNVDSLRHIVANLEKEKAELTRSKNVARERYLYIKEKVSGYEKLLLKKDKEIARLKEVNENLMSENIGLKTEKNELKQEINTLKSEKGNLTQKIEAAGILQAKAITIFRVKRNRLIQGVEFKRRNLAEIKIELTIAKNNLAEIEAKTIFFRMIMPDGSVAFNPVEGSGKTKIQNEEIFYTSKKSILFDNSEQRIEFNFNKGAKYDKGTYTIEFHTDGNLMGSTSFVVK